MRTIFTLFLLSLIITAALPQDLPNYMTEKEKEMLRTLPPPVFNPLFSTPPPSRVRTMAEWEELRGIMITWTAYTTILRQVVDYAQDEGLVYIVCSDSNSVKSFLTTGGVPLVNLKFLNFPFNSVWCRDYGPWTVYKEDVDSMYIIDWIYNRPTRPLDDNIPVPFAAYLNKPIYQTTTAPYNLIFTGGNYMVDGNGTAFASKLILNENPGQTSAQIDTIMKKYMGISRFVKMDVLPYDGIHHIDMHMKLLDEETILVGQYPTGVADGPQIEANLQYILNNFTTCYGKPYKVVRIQMPPDALGRYPDTGGDYRTYTNSVFVNKTVIIPTYELQYDTTALRVYREALPGYRIVGINSNQMITALGAIHCITKEVGVDEPVFISHSKLAGIVDGFNGYEVKAFIKSKSGIANAKVFWTTDTTQIFQQLNMNSLPGDTFIVKIPQQTQGQKIYYYISAASISGRSVTKPLTAPSGNYPFIAGAQVPVELLSFNAVTDGGKVKLFWSTATELNNKGFEIQRAVNPSGHIGVLQDNLIWNSVGFVHGFGTTSEKHDYIYIDESAAENGAYVYRLKQIDFDGSSDYSGNVEVYIYLPIQYSLEQNYPNPFNPSTIITYQVPLDSKISIKVYDLLGNEVAVLVDEFKSAGVYKIEFNGTGLSSGTYFYKMTSSGFTSVKKMQLVK